MTPVSSFLMKSLHHSIKGMFILFVAEICFGSSCTCYSMSAHTMNVQEAATFCETRNSTNEFFDEGERLFIRELFKPLAPHNYSSWIAGNSYFLFIFFAFFRCFNYLKITHLKQL